MRSGDVAEPLARSLGDLADGIGPQAGLRREGDRRGAVAGALLELHAELTTMRALGFCVSIDHARFMARHFTAHGIPSVAVWGDSPRDERHAALANLAAGRVRAVFSVDLFNEGVDVPAVDTVLMLRPTESPTLFLQQRPGPAPRGRGGDTARAWAPAPT